MSPRPNKFARGFTLLEMLVVLVIAAVMAGLAVFGMQDSPARKLQREANALAALINAAADEAVARSLELGLAIDARGYRFVYLDPETRRWQPWQQRPFAGHRFDAEYHIDFQLDGDQLDEVSRQRLQQFIDRSAADSEADLGDGDNRPLLLMLSSGEVTPFVLTLTSDAASYTLRSDGFNPVAVDIANDATLAGAR
jgi:general secretion pathway protein H